MTTKHSEHNPHHIKHEHFNPKNGKASAAYCITKLLLNTPPLMDRSAAYKKTRLNIFKVEDKSLS